MPEAVCIVCGEEKRSPWKICKSCGFDPNSSPDALVKSVYLSTGRYEDRADKDIYKDHLLKFSEDIKSGISVYYEECDILRLTKQMDSVISITWHALSIVVLKFFARFFAKLIAITFTLYLIVYLFMI